MVWVLFILLVRHPAELFLITTGALNRQHTFINIVFDLSYYAKATCFDHILVILKRIKCTD